MSLKRGSELKDLKFVRVCNKDYMHHGFKWQEGWNIDPLPFVGEGQCQRGGLYFSTLDNITDFIMITDGWTNMWIGDIELKDDELVWQEEDDGKWKAKQVKWTNIRQIKDCDCYIKNKLFRCIVQFSGWDIQYIPDKTLDLCRLAVLQNFWALKYVPDEWQQDLAEVAVRAHHWALASVSNKTFSLCKLAVEQDGWALQWVPEEWKQDLAEIAIRNDGRALEFVPHKTLELCRLAVQQNKWALEYVPDQFKQQLRDEFMINKK